MHVFGRALRASPLASLVFVWQWSSTLQLLRAALLVASLGSCHAAELLCRMHTEGFIAYHYGGLSCPCCVVAWLWCACFCARTVLRCIRMCALLQTLWLTCCTTIQADMSLLQGWHAATVVGLLGWPQQPVEGAVSPLCLICPARARRLWFAFEFCWVFLGWIHVGWAGWSCERLSIESKHGGRDISLRFVWLMCLFMWEHSVHGDVVMGILCAGPSLCPGDGKCTARHGPHPTCTAEASAATTNMGNSMHVCQTGKTLV